ncbi:MAG: cytochrome C [Chitinophagaceae bacterium]|nr:cytochrome C [Chitinophagaceae bacterium]
MNNQSAVLIFLDDDTKPFAEYVAPVNFELDTRKLVDGEHVLKIISKDPLGKEGIRKIPFVVRNGPAVAIEGITDNEVVDGIIPIMINAYGKGDQKRFIIEGSETPQSTPSWFWAIIIGFIAWAIYYAVTSLNTSL